MSFLSKDVGIDLGTANTLVYMKGKGIIMREPCIVAVDTKTDEVRCVGGEAKAVIGRTPGSIVAVRPLKDSVIADFDITANMLENFLKKGLRQQHVLPSPGGHLHSLRRYRGGAPRCARGYPEGWCPSGVCH